LEKISFFGLDFWNASSEEEVVDIITAEDNGGLFDRGNVSFMITPNAFEITQYFTKYPTIYHAFQYSGVILADGIPIVWLSKLRRRSLNKRLTGSNLFPLLWQRIRQTNKKAFFILPSAGMGERFHNEYALCDFAVPDLFDEKDDAYIRQFLGQHIDKILSLRPDYIFLGISAPKQHKMAIELHRLLSEKAGFNCLIATLGASFEFYFGIKKRAPAFFQKTGTEWLYRFWQEPKRTWRRYTIGNVVFLGIAIKELFKRT
jgi:N-acetylglucosaminyldiphosphoundecaprenol N-acetyl-beta-D-mannosaminyltransferase